ncbi:uncharacterized protein LOC144912767 [Branchiostoma floridae x Branchiostoma belcheri]
MIVPLHTPHDYHATIKRAFLQRLGYLVPFLKISTKVRLRHLIRTSLSDDNFPRWWLTENIMADTPKRARFYEKRRVEGRKPAKSIAIEVEMGDEARLTNLMDSWRKARDGFVVKGDTKTGNADFLEHLLDMYRKSHETDGLTLLANVANTPRPTAHPNFAKNLHTAVNQEDELFITTQSCVATLLAQLGACPALKGDRGDTCGGELSIKEMERYCVNLHSENLQQWPRSSA